MTKVSEGQENGGGKNMTKKVAVGVGGVVEYESMANKKRAEWKGSYAATLRVCRESGNAVDGCDKWSVPPSMRDMAGRLIACREFGGYCSLVNCRKWHGVK